MQEQIFDRELKQFLDEELLKRSLASSLTFVCISIVAVLFSYFFDFFNPIISTLFAINLFLNLLRFKLAYNFSKGKEVRIALHEYTIYLTLTTWSLIFIFGGPMDIQNNYSLYFIMYIQVALVLAGTFTSVVVNRKLCDYLITMSLVLPTIVLLIRSFFQNQILEEIIAFVVAYVFMALYAFRQSRQVRSGFVMRFRSEWLLKCEKRELKSTLENLRATQNELEVQRAHALNVAKNISLGDMAAGIAHEINNPLAVIIGHCDITEAELTRLREELRLPTDKVQNSISKIKASSLRIENIIKGLRFFSKTSDAEVFTDNNFNQVLEGTLTFLNEKIKRLSIQMQLDLAEENIIYSQAVNLSHVLFHLINNAIEAVTNQEVRQIKIRTHWENQNFVCSIEDSGLGISLSIQNRIFEPFFTTKEIGKGSGLGLSIANGIIESHKGALYLDPMNNRKMVFKIPTPSVYSTP